METVNWGDNCLHIFLFYLFYFWIMKNRHEETIIIIYYIYCRYR
jgi:hypothetical protein